MKADDPRHGTTRGFHAGCREQCCRRALARDEKRRRLDKLRGGRAVPAIGAQRRIRALMRLGWTSTDIAQAAGCHERNYVLRILNGQKGKPTTWLERKTDKAIRDVYERLSMRLPDPAPHRARTRALAERRGYPPPLAWDDIDNPDEEPSGMKRVPSWTAHAEARRADLEHFVGADMSLDEACRELSLDRDSLWQWCKRHDALGIYERLARGNRRGANQWTGGAA